MASLSRKNDYSLFTHCSNGKYTFVLVYVDDLLLTGDDTSCLSHLKAQLHAVFTIKDLGLTRYFLGIELARSYSGILLNQRKYVLDMLACSLPSSQRSSSYC